MILDFSILAIISGGAWLTDTYVRRRIERRRALNRLLAVAAEDFQSAAKSLLRTPDELTPGVLEALSLMGETGFAKNSEKFFLSALRKARAAKDLAIEPIDYENMRPELKVLFRKAGVAWFNIMTHKSSWYHHQIAIEAMNSEADHFSEPKRSLATANAMRLELMHAA